MKESFCLIILLCVYVVVNGQSVCVSEDDTKDIQLMPGCSLQNVISKAVGHFQLYLSSYPTFPDQSVCGDETEDLLEDIVSDAMDCMVGTCAEGVTTTNIMFAANSLLANHFTAMSPGALTGIMGITKGIMNQLLKMNDTSVDMICPEAPGQTPPLMQVLIGRIQNMFGIDSSKLDNLTAVIGVLFQQPEVLQEASTAEGGLCRFFSHNAEAIFDDADMTPFMEAMIYGALEAMGLGSNFDLATAIDLDDLAGKGLVMILEALETPLCVGSCKVPTLPNVTSDSQWNYIQSEAVTFICASGYFTPQPTVRTCANGTFDYPFNVNPLQCFSEVEYPSSELKQQLNNLLAANEQAGVFNDSVTLAEVVLHHQQHPPPTTTTTQTTTQSPTTTTQSLTTTTQSTTTTTQSTTTTTQSTTTTTTQSPTTTLSTTTTTQSSTATTNQQQSKPAAQQVCISEDDEDREDIQLMPGCSLKNLINKAVGQFQLYLSSYPSFPDQSVCGKAAQDLLEAVISDAMDCMVGNCTEGVTTTYVMNAANSILSSIFLLMEPHVMTDTMNNAKIIMNELLELNATSVDMICPETPGQTPPLMQVLIGRMQEMFGIDSSRLDNLAVVIGVLFQQPEVLQQKPDDWSLCRFFAHNAEATFGGADMKPFMELLIYGAVDAMGLGSSYDLATVIDLDELAEKALVLILDALQTPLCFRLDASGRKVESLLSANELGIEKLQSLALPTTTTSTVPQLINTPTTTRSTTTTTIYRHPSPIRHVNYLQSRLEAQKTCVSPADRKDVQLMPGCSLKSVVGQSVAHFQLYLTSYPAFPDQSVCGKATQDLLTAIINDAMDCMVGDCAEGITTDIIADAANPILARQLKLMKPGALRSAMEIVKRLLNEQVQLTAKDVDIFCPKTPNQSPPLIDHLHLIQNLLGIRSSKLGNLEVVMKALYQQPEVLQQALEADGSLCRFFSRNAAATFDDANLNPFMELLIYGALEAMGLGSNINLNAVINVDKLAKQGAKMIVEQLEAPWCIVQDRNCKVPDLPFITSSSPSKYIQGGTITFTCASGYFTPQPTVRTCANGKFNYPFDVDPLQCFRKVDYPNSMMKQRLNNLLTANKRAGVFDDAVTLAKVVQYHQRTNPAPKRKAQKVSSRASAKTSIIPVIFGCFFVILFAQLMLSPE